MCQWYHIKKIYMYYLPIPREVRICVTIVTAITLQFYHDERNQQLAHLHAAAATPLFPQTCWRCDPGAVSASSRCLLAPAPSRHSISPQSS